MGICIQHVSPTIHARHAERMCIARSRRGSPSKATREPCRKCNSLITILPHLVLLRRVTPANHFATVPKHRFRKQHYYIQEQLHSPPRPPHRRRRHRFHGSRPARHSPRQETRRLELFARQRPHHRRRPPRSRRLLPRRRSRVLGRTRGKMGQDCAFTLQWRQVVVVLLFLPARVGGLYGADLGF